MMMKMMIKMMMKMMMKKTIFYHISKVLKRKEYPCFFVKHMKYPVKSAIVGRMKRKSKDESTYPCFISLFNITAPHRSGQVPDKILDFERIRKVMIKGLEINYELAGNDLILDNLDELSVEQEGEVITVSGKQKK